MRKLSHDLIIIYPVVMENIFPKIEEKVLEYWDANNTFKKSIENRRGAQAYVFYDGPPFATGLPHYGHLLASTIKDVIPRYWTMKGFKVERKWGWDCHGLPIENIIEKKLGLNSRKDIEEIGIKKFCEECKNAIFLYDKEWEKTIHRLGRWVDFKNSYKTMDNTYMESVWWAFKELWKKGLIYKGTRTALYCSRCETPLTNFEIAMDNSYKEVEDKSAYVLFRSGEAEVVANGAKGADTSEAEGGRNSKSKKVPRYFLAWTTTPWTLPGNRALAIAPAAYYYELYFEKGEMAGNILVIARDRVHDVMFGIDDKNYRVIREFNGKELVGETYQPVYFSESLISGEKDYRVYAADFVTMDEGTGIVHIAPSFGETDHQLGVREGLELTDIIDSAGRYNEKIPEWRGKKVWDANEEIIDWLKNNGKLFKKESVHHTYPFCHRCQTKLLFYTYPAWYINIQKIKKDLIEQNEYINWFPEHLKHGRFLHGLSDAPDWCISRSRFWGTPIPVWACDSCGEQAVIGSFAEIKKLAPETPDNLDFHRPYIDEVFWNCAKCDGKMSRIKDVFDCWVESGSMPFASKHYPFENRGKFEEDYPAEFIAEYIAQTRGWFYTLHVLSVAIFSKPAFVNCVTTGTILAEDGTKMSKSKGNFPDPWILIEKYGVDALRFYLMSSAVMQAENVNFSERDVDEAYKKVIMIFWNMFSFWEMYAPAAEKELPLENITPGRKHIMDRWVAAYLEKLIKDVTVNMDNYEIVKAAKLIVSGMADFSQWFVRRIRERAKTAVLALPLSLEHADGLEALNTLRYVLGKLTEIIAPFTPFIAERIYQGLGGAEESVHLKDWPDFHGEYMNEEILKNMEDARSVIETALALRAEAVIKVRQPLPTILISGLIFKNEFLDIIKEELNVKEVECVKDFSALEIATWKIKENSGFGVALNTSVSQDLEIEGWGRDLVRKINMLRKKAGLTVKDKINLYWNGDKKFASVFKDMSTETMKATLADRIEAVGNEEEIAKFEKGGVIGERTNVGGSEIWIGIEKI